MSLLAMAERVAPAPGQPYQIFVVGFGLGTVDPADARRQMGLDPTQAVALMAERLPKLGRSATINLVFPAAAGPQPAPNPLNPAWPEGYWKANAAATGACLGDVGQKKVKATAST